VPVERCALHTSIRIAITDEDVPLTTRGLKKMSKAYGAVALVRVINPDCGCKGGAAPERISKGMYPRGALRSTLTGFFFFVSACKRQVPLTHDVAAVPVTPDDLSATGKENCLAHARVAKKKGVLLLLLSLSLEGVEAPPAPYKEGSGVTRKRGDVRC
jgi:hypothetical protein